jgi:hypothetical protein
MSFLSNIAQLMEGFDLNKELKKASGQKYITINAYMYFNSI